MLTESKVTWPWIPTSGTTFSRPVATRLATGTTASRCQSTSFPICGFLRSNARARLATDPLAPRLHDGNALAFSSFNVSSNYDNSEPQVLRMIWKEKAVPRAQHGSDLVLHLEHFLIWKGKLVLLLLHCTLFTSMFSSSNFLQWMHGVSFSWLL